MKKTTWTLVVACLSSVPSAHAIRRNPECVLRDDPNERIINTSSQGGSYQQPMASGRYVTSMGGGSQGGNTNVNLQDGTTTPLPDGIDPFPTPDERFIVQPSPLRFTRFVNGEAASSPVYTDPDHRGWYQSVGLVSQGTDTANYRVLTAQGNGNIRDYHVTFDATGVPTFAPVQAAPVPLCPSIRDQLDLSLPIMNKDGTEFATVDRRTNTTRIFRIDATTGECTLTGDLGVRTGKVNFSFDGKQVAFQAAPLQVGNVSSPSASYSTQAFVYNRESQRITPLTHAGIQDTTAQYPGFTRDGKVVYQRAVRSGGNYTRSYVVVNPALVASIPAPNSGTTPSCFRDLNEYYGGLAALGELWRKTCLVDAQGIAGRGNAITLGLNLSQDACRALVNRFYNQEFIDWLSNASGTDAATTRATLEQLPASRLIAACPGGAPANAGGAPTIVGQATIQTSQVPAVIQEKCSGCHGRNSPSGYIPFENLDLLNSTAPSKSGSTQASLRKEIERRINAGASGRMPIGGDELSDAERTTVRTYLTGSH